MPCETENNKPRLDNECLAISRYLFGQEVGTYVQIKYSDGNARLSLDAQAGRFDRLLLALAVRHPLLARACDAYARFFAPQGVLRKKMVLLLAIAEVSPPTCRVLDASDAGGLAMFFARTMLKGIVTVFCLLLALPVLLPLQLLLKLAGKRRREGGYRA